MFIIVGAHTFNDGTTKESAFEGMKELPSGEWLPLGTFKTKDEADAFLTELEEDIYYLQHNESCRPTYRVEPIEWSTTGDD